MTRQIFIAVTVWLGGCSASQLDADLEYAFAKNQVLLNALVDGSICSTPTEVAHWVHRPQNTTTACIELMRKADVYGVGPDGLSGGIMVFMNKTSAVTTHKNLVFSRRPLSPLHKSLDEVPLGLQPYARAYRKMDVNWYISFEYSS